MTVDEITFDTTIDLLGPNVDGEPRSKVVQVVTCCMRGRYTMLNTESLGAANLWGGKATCSFVCYAMLADESIDSVGNWSYHAHDFIMGPVERIVGVPLAGAVVTCHCTYVGPVLEEALDAQGASANAVK